MTDKDKILDRISKLLAKANGTENEAEATAFMEKAMAMLAEHGLSLLDIPEKDRQDGFISKNFVPRYSNEEWRQRLAMCAAKVYMVKIIFSRGVVPVRGGKLGVRVVWIVIGRPVNVSIFISMTDYILETIMRFRKQAKHIKGRNDQNQFQIGCGMRVSKRLLEMYDEMVGTEEVPASGNLPVLYKTEDDLIEGWTREMFDLVTLKPRKLGFEKGNNALIEGWKKGADVSLQDQVGDENTNQFLLGQST